MYVKFCDRCGRKTNNGLAFLIPTTEQKGHYRVDNTWFGEEICLCNNCLNEFDKWRVDHDRFNKNFVEEDFEKNE